MRAGLLRRRLVLLDRRIDASSANAAIAQLLLLDGQDPSEIRVVVNASGGELTAALALHDVLRRCVSPIATVCLGEAAGVAVLALSGGTRGRRQVSSGARIRLELGRAETEGRMADVSAWAHELETLVLRFARALAEDCGRHVEEVEHDLHRGRSFEPREAVAYGIADAVLDPKERLA